MELTCICLSKIYISHFLAFFFFNLFVFFHVMHSTPTRLTIHKIVSNTHLNLFRSNWFRHSSFPFKRTSLVLCSYTKQISYIKLNANDTFSIFLHHFHTNYLINMFLGFFLLLLLFTLKFELRANRIWNSNSL